MRRTFVVQLRESGPATIEDVMSATRVAVDHLESIPAHISAWSASSESPRPDELLRLRAKLERERAGRRPDPLGPCRALIALGLALLEAGEVEEARGLIGEALAAAEGTGEEALASVARSALIDAGARPRRATTRGPAALTPSERGVAERVAEGCSNREVAESLFLSEKTVEGHLRGVFRKLGIRSRTEIAAELEGAPTVNHRDREAMSP